MFAAEWESIYQKGEQLNAYPYTEVVSLLHRFKSHNTTGNILDVGCGSGVHAELFAKFGFNVDAFDGSRAAIDFAKKKYQEIEEINFFEMTTDSFMSDTKYDLVLDRLCTSQTGLLSTKNFYKNIKVNLNTGATIFWKGFCYDNSGKEFAQFFDKNNGYWDDFTDGEFKGLGCTTFFTISDVESIFDGYELKDIKEISDKNYKTKYLANHWQVEAVIK